MFDYAKVRQVRGLIPSRILSWIDWKYLREGFCTYVGYIFLLDIQRYLGMTDKLINGQSLIW